MGQREYIYVSLGMDSNAESGFEFGLNGCVEASKGIIGGSVEFSLLVDVVLVEFLADDVDPEQDFEHAHVLFLWCLVLEGGEREFWEIYGEREEVNLGEDYFFSLFLASFSCLFLARRN